MSQVEKMSDLDCVKLGGLEGPILYVDASGEHVMANDAAVALLGESWRTSAQECVSRSDARVGLEEWHHGAVTAEVDGKRLELAVHATRGEDGCQLLVLEEATTPGPKPSAGLEHILEGISDCFFAVDRDGVFVYANSRAADFFGKSREELMGENLKLLPSEELRFGVALNKTIGERESVTYDARIPGQNTWIEIRAYPVEEGMAVYFSDITDRIATQDQLSFMALHDPLTRLPNRRYLQEHLVRAVAKARRGTPSTLLFMDMDRFKIVNDTVGHAAGDAVIVEFAGLVCSCARTEDVLSRFGGDEFALLLDGVCGSEAECVAQRIHDAVRAHEFRVGAHTFSLGVSIGMADIDGTLDEGLVMNLADDAMYTAKNLGGGQTCRRTTPGNYIET